MRVAAVLEGGTVLEGGSLSRVEDSFLASRDNEHSGVSTFEQ